MTGSHSFNNAKSAPDATPARRKPEYIVGDFEKFKVTGVLRNGTRFHPIFTTNYTYANGINLYRGTLFGFHKESKQWKKLKEVYNY